MERKRAYQFRAVNQFDSSIAHYTIARDFYASASRRDLYYHCIAHIADNLLRLTQFGQLDSLLTSAVPAARSELGEHHQTTAELYGLIGYLRSYQDRYDEAIDYSQRSLAIRMELFGPNHLLVAASYVGLGMAYRRSGKYEDAMTWLLKAKEIQVAAKDSGKVDLVYTLVAIGSLYDLQSNPSRALETFSEELSLLAETGLETSPLAARCYHFLAICHKSLGEPEKAANWERKALDVFRQVYGEHNLNTASALGQMGDYQTMSGDFETAVRSYDEARSLMAALVGENHSSVNEMDRKTAGLYAMRGDYTSALEIDLRVVKTHARDFGPANPELGYLHQEIAEMYGKQGEARLALEHYANALTLREGFRSAGPRLDIAEILCDEGKVYCSIGELDSASAVLGRALSIQQSAALTNPTLRSSTFRTLAEVSKQRGDIAVSAGYYQQSLIALCPGFSDTSISTNPPIPNTMYCREYAGLLEAKAEILLETAGANPVPDAHLTAALDAYSRASDALERLRRSYRSEGSKLALQEKGSPVYDAGINVALRIADRTHDPAARETAFTFSERNKASILLDGLRTVGVQHYAGVPDRLVEEEALYQRDLSRLLARAEWLEGHPDSANAAAVRSSILETNRKIDQVEDSVAQLNPRFHDLFYGARPASVRDIQSVLDTGTCLVEYTLSGKSLYTFVVRANSFDTKAVMRPQLDSLAGMLRHALRTMDNEDYLTAARELYTELIQPIEKLLTGAKRLVIIPDGALYYIPFEVLLFSGRGSPNGKERTDYRHLPYLLNRYEISYALSGTLFYETQTGMSRKPGGVSSFAGFAPVSRQSPVIVALLRQNRNGESDRTGFSSLAVDGRRFGALPYSGDEVRSIAMAFTSSGRTASCITGSDATKEEFAARAPGNSVIHIATHGVIDEDHPGLSALVFAPGPGSAPDESALLYAAETYNLRLDADLVTLSSCESGVGKLVRGEGLMAMTRGFFYAGARNVICSLWKVYDKHADQLMRGFYRHVLQGRSFSAALREAKTEMMENEATANPFTWAGFELIGE